MTTRILLMLALLVSIATSQAQLQTGSWGNPKPVARARQADASPSTFGRSTLFHRSELSEQDLTGNPCIAEAATPEIEALASGLQNDPKRIFDFVHDHIEFQYYFGSKKGAAMTLLERSGSDFDQCALLVALLRAAGYTNLQYQFSTILMPYDSTNHQDFHHWVKTTLTNTVWTNTYNLANYIFQERGFYPWFDSVNGDDNDLIFHHVWVQLTLGGTNYLLDPSFKVNEPISGIDLHSAIGVNTNDLYAAAGGTSTSNFVSGLDEGSLRSTLTGYTTNLLACLHNNYPNADVTDILSGWAIQSSASQPLGQSLPWQVYDYDGSLPMQTWDNIPTNYMSTLTIAFGGTNQFFYLPQLQGKRLSLTTDISGDVEDWLNGADVDLSEDVELWLDDQPVLQTSQLGTATGMWITNLVHHPFGYWDTNANVLVDEGYEDGGSVNQYFWPFPGDDTTNCYVLLYAFDPHPAWLRERQTRLDAYRSQGLADDSREVKSENLYVMGLNWLVQTELALRAIGAQENVLQMNYHRIGRMGLEDNQGYFIDIFLQLSAVAPASGASDSDIAKTQRAYDVGNFFQSAFEHGVIEEMIPGDHIDDAASTIKMLQLANARGQSVWLLNTNNWNEVVTNLINYEGFGLDSLGAAVAQGYQLLIPQNGLTTLDRNGGGWGGFGMVTYADQTNFTDFGMLIVGQYFQVNGGRSHFSTDIPDPGFISTIFGWSQPDYFNPNNPFIGPPATGGDPVRMADGALQISSTDLSLGQTEPRGVGFTRYYSPTRRYANTADLGNGWTHNYAFSLARVSAPLPGLGTTTPAQMASLLVATRSALDLFQQQPDPKNWMLTVLTAKWAIDQLIQNSVSISLGTDAVQFIKQPDGSFTPPASCTMSLSQSNSDYLLQERHGRIFDFLGNYDEDGNPYYLLAFITGQYGQSLALAYDENNVLQTVTDWKGRTLTFNYTDNLLSSIGDSAGRTVSYGYSGTDLISVTDPENNTRTFSYDTNHQVTAIYNALDQLIVTNIYDDFGRVVTQYTRGDTNQNWQYFWSGWENIVQDPAGGRQTYFYDDKSRLVAQQDALGNVGQTVYDGQDHVVLTVSPLNEINQFVYDGDQNLIGSVDALGFTNQFFYDAQFNLIRAVDARGNSSTFGYNAQFSLTGSTNGAGDYVNYNFNSDGTLHTRTDAGGTTTFGYDSEGQLNGITYPGSLGSESFVNNSVGDPTSHTDANGNVTAFSYNNRRELTNTIAPTNLTMTIRFDAVGNVASLTDARGNSTSNTWSATRQLLATTLPPTPQGVPMVTNVYDNRDWLIRTVDPLQNTTRFTNDLAGRLMAATDPLARTTTFGYDADGRKLATTNAQQEVTRQTFDVRGSLLKLADGAGHFSTRAYDAAGNQVTLTNRNGKKWQFQFDAANRLTNTLTPLNRSTSLTFNHQGLPVTIKDPASQTTSLFYDAKGRLTNRTDNVATTLYTYDANDNRTSVAENGLTNSWSVDAYNRVSAYKDVYGNLIQYRYDANGNLINLVYPGDKTVAYAYDSLNRMTNVTDWSGRKTAIAYDLASHITSITRPNGSYRTIGYDAAGQATNILEQMANSLPIAIFKMNWTNSGSMAWEFAAPLPHTVTVPTRTMTYDDDNRLATVNSSSVTNDAAGNLIYAPLVNGTFAPYAFDARNRLLNAGGVTNAYDAAGNRIGTISATNVTVLVVNPNAKLPQVLMRIKNGVTNYYIYGPGLLYQITETSTTTNTLTYHYDYRGSTIALSADSGVVTDRIEYSAYGLTTYRTGTSDTPFLFNGRYGVQTDVNGLFYMRARYYNPYLCRFVSADPSGFGGGLNHYAYANGNPISLLDPFGLGAIGENASPSWLSYPYRQMGDFYAAENADPFSNANLTGILLGGFLDGIDDAFGNFGAGTANAYYHGQSGWDWAIGIAQDIQRGTLIFNLIGAPEAGLVKSGTTTTIAAEGTEPLLSTTSGSGMDPALFQRIQTAFQRNGGVMQANADSTGILNSLGAEGATLDANTILLPENPSTSAVYEELIHSAQLRAGMTDTTEMEIQAAQKLIRFSDQYNIPASETQQTINRLNNLLQQQGH